MSIELNFGRHPELKTHKIEANLYCQSSTHLYHLYHRLHHMIHMLALDVVKISAYY